MVEPAHAPGKIALSAPSPLPGPVLRSRDFARKTFAPRHRPVARALGEALYSPDGEVSEERLDAFVDEVDAYLSPASKTLRFALKLMLDVLRVAPILIVGKLAMFENLSREDRIRMLERMDRHRISLFTMILVAFKTMMTIVFYEDPEELRRIGYPGEERHRYKRVLPIVEPATSAPNEEVTS